MTVLEDIDASARQIGRDLKIMEVCGSHTMAIFRSGLRQVLPKNIRLVSGPGCPVCVTDQGDLERVVHLALQKDVILVTFGDMLKVPSAQGNLFEAKAKGADIRVVYSPLEAIGIAQENPGKTVVYNAIGFETTAPLTAVLIKKAEEKNVQNLKIYSSHKLVPPALYGLLSGGSALDALILPGHVSAIIGLEPYGFVAKDFKKPAVAAGFEAENILMAIQEILRQVIREQSEIKSVYPVITQDGNRKALEAILKYFDVEDAVWRGFGLMEKSGLGLKKNYCHYDAKENFDPDFKTAPTPAGCKCGEIIKGQAEPVDCHFFGMACKPGKAIGPCMVSSEGTCAAWFKYGFTKEGF